MGTPGFVTLTLEIHRINIGKWKLDAFERYISIYKYYLREPCVTSMVFSTTHLTNMLSLKQRTMK